ncbi:hypothetical protein A3709_19680 [Halioglobus sp. HI00S01]|uniref:hypothetical protein n=1 Tax=Halioglobus sp. HI00S01 TaxID=1822214 RepID=UPI0007C2D56B|nr:hypothetical protein [Halioglobus sp. HI00S01]KZX57847.1 hypothetical protein A3709_19680 [Halioglobus sp. HI00S01]
MPQTKNRDHLSSSVDVVIDDYEVRPDSRNTFDSLRGHLAELPQVAAGAVSMEEADRWLHAASKVWSTGGVYQLLQQSKGFGALDMRALYADASGEYYPGYSASEVIDQKLLRRVALPATQRYSGEKLLERIAKTVVIEQHGLERSLEAEGFIAKHDTTTGVPWMIGRAPLIGVTGDSKTLFDIQVATEGNRLLHDETTLSYLSLCAANKGVALDGLIMITVEAEPGFSATIQSIAQVSQNAKDMVGELASEFALNMPDGLRVSLAGVTPNPQLMQELADLGMARWEGAVMSGAGLTVEQQKPAPLPVAGYDEVADAQRRYLGAQAVEQAAKSERQKAKIQYENVVRALEETHGDFELPLKYPAIQTRITTDWGAAAEYIEEVANVPKSRLYETEVDARRLSLAYEAGSNEPVSKFEIVGKPDPDKITDIAKQLGISLEPFAAVQKTAISPTTTRGEEFSVLTEHRAAAHEAVSALVTQSANSPTLRDGTLYKSPPGPAKTAGVDLEPAREHGPSKMNMGV